MQTVCELIAQWCSEQEILGQSTEDRMAFPVTGVNGQFLAVVLPLEEERAMVCLFGMGTFVPEQQRGEAAKQLAELNYPLKLGAIHLDVKTGELSLRMTQFLPDDDQAAIALVGRVITALAYAMDQLLPSLIRLCCL